MRRRSTSRAAIKYALSQWQSVVAAHTHTQCVCAKYFHSWWRNTKARQMWDRARGKERMRLWAHIEKDSFKLLTINEALHVTHFHVSLNFRTVAVFFSAFFLLDSTHLHIVCKAKYVRLWKKKHAKILYTWYAYLFIANELLFSPLTSSSLFLSHSRFILLICFVFIVNVSNSRYFLSGWLIVWKSLVHLLILNRYFFPSNFRL